MTLAGLSVVFGIQLKLGTPESITLERVDSEEGVWDGLGFRTCGYRVKEYLSPKLRKPLSPQLLNPKQSKPGALPDPNP